MADAMVGNVLQRLVAEDQGFATIPSFGEEALDLQGGVATSNTVLATRPDVVHRYFVAAVKATRVMVDDPATSLDVLLKYVELDRDAAARGLEWVRPLTAKDGLLSPAEQPEILAVMRETYEITEDVEVSQVFDFRPLQEAARTVDASGWKPR
jgi:ABC-type nitrate/sulfonate/bicarbonate transport system substrate-binding protein